jgi:SAM-dependent methyltransferase
MASPETGTLHYLDAHSLNYGPDYFLDEYRKQYGKTYLEDEASLRTLANRRLDMIARFVRPPVRILEIGCAAGFFLDEARRRGYETAGIEPSPFASEHADRKLGLEVIRSPFNEESIGLIRKRFSGDFDVVAAFFVIEHIPDQAGAFCNIRDLLRPGGIFAFALPSTFGPLGTLHPRDFALTHPVDHFADYSPHALRSLFPLYGMRARLFRPCSYHPERVHPIVARPPLRSLYRIFADALAFGDTMEGVAQRQKGPIAGR